MKPILVVLAAAVVASLACYAAFNSLFRFGLMGNQVVLNLDVFIGFIACLSVLAAVLALSFRAGLARSDDRLVKRLENRITELENRDSPSARPVHTAGHTQP